MFSQENAHIKSEILFHICMKQKKKYYIEISLQISNLHVMLVSKKVAANARIITSLKILFYLSSF